MIREKKIPTILAILFLLVSLFAGVLLIQKGQVFFLRASPEITPSQMKMTNVSSSSFTVSWITEKETSGFIRFGETPSLGQTFADDRDQISGSTGSFQTHYVSLKNLKPKTTYFFKLGSGGKIFDNSGKPYEIATAGTISGTFPPSDLVSGTILGSDNTPVDGAIVYLKMANVTPQSALVRSSGSFIIPLNTALSENLLGFASYDKEAQVEEIFVQGGSRGTATAITTTKNDNPLPEITLGKSYDFRQAAQPEEEESVFPTPSPQPESEVQATPSSKFSFTELAPPKEATTSVELAIISPEQNEKISTQKPEILGTGPVNQTIQIVIESPTYTGTVKTNSQGDWSFTPPTNLTPGVHTVKVSFGGKTISQTFTVLAAGESELPAFTATPSATITPLPTPKLTPTPTATPSARTAMPATEAGVPSPGYLTPTFSVFIMGLVFILIGFVVEKILAHAR